MGGGDERNQTRHVAVAAPMALRRVDGFGRSTDLASTSGVTTSGSTAIGMPRLLGWASRFVASLTRGG